MYVCVCVCVRACVRACVCERVRVCVFQYGCVAYHVLKARIRGFVLCFFIVYHGRFLCEKFGLLSPGERAHRHKSSATHYSSLFFLSACVFVFPIRVSFFYRIFAQGNSFVAVGSFTWDKYVLHTGPRFIVSSERLAPRPPLTGLVDGGKSFEHKRRSNPDLPLSRQVRYLVTTDPSVNLARVLVFRMRQWTDINCAARVKEFPAHVCSFFHPVSWLVFLFLMFRMYECVLYQQMRLSLCKKNPQNKTSNKKNKRKKEKKTHKKTRKTKRK